ncbi:MAG: beta-ketoacyl-ACP synthase II [Puniceicoccales bacterium]|jgi:3-oxoacyl-[acyl-carrier-protein] synthase II|nr:beta-ketoacyl-ACP synthase II [Puniceicoccales bacterium]
MVDLSRNSLRRVVVTGLGAVTPLGPDFTSSWDGLVAGRTGVGPLTKIDASLFPCRVAAEVQDFDAGRFLDGKEVRRHDPFTHYAVAAAHMARDDAALHRYTDPQRVGVIIGSGIGGLRTIDVQSRILHSQGPRRVSPFMIPALIADMASGVAAIGLGARGPNFAALTACSSGAHSIGEAYHFLRLGKADAIFAGGTEGSVNAFSIAGFCAMRAVSTAFNDDPARASRPFDADRDGFVVGEGACVLVLETLDHALARGARIYCEVTGYAASCDAHHVTAPVLGGEVLAQTIGDALRESALEPGDVDYVNAHGTSTPYNDLCESNAYKLAFGEEAYRIPISSVKGATGHMLGAAGAFEAAVCARTIVTGIIPPTLNYERPDPACDLNYVPNVAIRREVRVAVSDNLGFGGHNAALVFQKFSPP